MNLLNYIQSYVNKFCFNKRKRNFLIKLKTLYQVHNFPEGNCWKSKQVPSILRSFKMFTIVLPRSVVGYIQVKRHSIKEMASCIEVLRVIN